MSFPTRLSWYWQWRVRTAPTGVHCFPPTLCPQHQPCLMFPWSPSCPHTLGSSPPLFLFSNLGSPQSSLQTQDSWCDSLVATKLMQFSTNFLHCPPSVQFLCVAVFINGHKMPFLQVTQVQALLSIHMVRVCSVEDVGINKWQWSTWLNVLSWSLFRNLGAAQQEIRALWWGGSYYTKACHWMWL